MIDFFAGFLIPIYLGISSRGGVALGVGALGIGVVLHLTNVALIRYYVAKWDPALLEDGLWELTAGLGIVPRWVSRIGLFGWGLMLGGAASAVTALLR